MSPSMAPPEQVPGRLSISKLAVPGPGAWSVAPHTLIAVPLVLPPVWVKVPPTTRNSPEFAIVPPLSVKSVL